MIEKKEKAVCTPIHLKIADKVLSGSVCKLGENELEFKPTNEKQLKKLKEL